jgi:hypothetical protein
VTAYSNENLDDIANAATDYEIEMKIDKNTVTTDLDQTTAVNLGTSILFIILMS